MSNRKLYKTIFIATDFLAAYLVWIIFCLFREHLSTQTIGNVTNNFLFEAGYIAIFWVILYFILGFYRDIFHKSRVKEILNLIWISIAGVVIIFFGLLLKSREPIHDYTFNYNTLTAYWGLHLFISAFIKTLIITYTKKLIRKKIISFNTLIVGANSKALNFYKELNKSNNFLGFNIKGFLQVLPTNKTSAELYNLGHFTQLPQLIAQLQIEEVVIAIDPSEHQRISEILTLLEDQPVRISILPDLYQILLGSVRVNHLFGTPLIEIKHNLMPVWQEITKRIIDILVSAVLLISLLPVYLVIAIIVKLSSPGPVIYGQERIGKGGVPFNIYKFRSMYVDAEKLGPTLSFDKDPRVTPWGQFMRKIRLDELPQFYNVLIGDMSLVGPRPERKYYIDQIIKIAPHYKHLLRVRPGITSLGLVKFGYAQNLNEMIKRLKYDILYIENMSLAMDLRVILYTLKVIIEGRGK